MSKVHSIYLVIILILLYSTCNIPLNDRRYLMSNLPQPYLNIFRLRRCQKKICFSLQQYKLHTQAALLLIKKQKASSTSLYFHSNTLPKRIVHLAIIKLTFFGRFILQQSNTHILETHSRTSPSDNYISLAPLNNPGIFQTNTNTIASNYFQQVRGIIL